MNLPAYPKYKPSGVEWLGDVPEHWEVKRSDGIVSTERSQLAPEVFKDQEVFHYSIPAVQEFGTGIVEDGEGIASAKQPVKRTTLLVSKLNPRKATICIAEPQDQLTLCSNCSGKVSTPKFSPLRAAIRERTRKTSLASGSPGLRSLTSERSPRFWTSGRGSWMRWRRRSGA